MLCKYDDLTDDRKRTMNFLFEQFSNSWGKPSDDSHLWMGVWGYILNRFSKLTIEHACEFATQNLRKQPSGPEFRILCDRIDNKERLTEPIAFSSDKIAKKLLDIPLSDLGCESKSDFIYACLTAAAVATIKENQSVGLPWNKDMLEIDLKHRMQAIADETLEWIEDARNFKGVWANELNQK